jgi:two-component sensor histidine kinase/CheY-like chemotaxis protein
VWNFSSSPIGRDAIGRRLIVTMAVDLTERKRAEARLLLLMREVDHRAKNALTVVQSVLHLTRADNPADFIAAVEGRLASMARAHTLLAASHWSGADLRSLIVDELAAYGGPGRMVIAGSPVAIAAEATQAVAMNLHELATNAAKYGALSTAAGRVDVTWMVESADRGGCLTLDWVERGGPPVAVPEKIGFGSTMLRQTVETQLGGQLTLDWHPAGLMCRIAMPADCFSTSGVTLVPEGAVMVPAAADAAPGGRVLVVEDEALTALALEQVLMEAGFVVLGPVGRIEDALDILGSMRPDVAVLDVNLFGQDVYPVANRLVEMGVPFLFCSGYAKLDDIGEHLKRAPHLSKPVLADHLLATLTSLLGAGREDKAVA